MSPRQAGQTPQLMPSTQLILPTLWPGKINKPLRFGKLKKDLDTITSQMLSKQLKEMENDTLVKRKVVKSNPITVEYSLTQFGNSSLPIIRSLVKWGSINKRKMSRVIEKDQERVIDLLHDEIRFKNLQRKNFYG